MGKADAKPKKKSSEKKKKKEGPKRPPSSFIFFSKEMRPKLKVDHPEWSFGEYGKELGRRWKAMGDAQKKKYQDMTDKAKAEYAKAKAAFDQKAKNAK